MFHHTHAYLASKLYKSEDTLLLIGSILPDLAITGSISWEDGLHGGDNDAKFTSFIEEKYPEFLHLAKGVHAHNIVDDFTHIHYKGKIGYAFQNNKELVALISQFYELDDQKAEGKAHNFIESGVEIFLLLKNPEIQQSLKSATLQVDREKLSQILAEYFHKDPKNLQEAINRYFELFTSTDFSQKENWITFWTELEKLMKLKPIGNGKREQLLNKAQEITKHNYHEFLEYSLIEGIRHT